MGLHSRQLAEVWRAGCWEILHVQCWVSIPKKIEHRECNLNSETKFIVEPLQWLSEYCASAQASSSILVAAPTNLLEIFDLISSSLLFWQAFSFIIFPIVSPSDWLTGCLFVYLPVLWEAFHLLPEAFTISYVTNIELAFHSLTLSARRRQRGYK